MRLSAALVLGSAIGCAAMQTAVAAERGCLTADERRAVIAARKAVPLASAMHVVRARIPGDVLKARLCRQDKALVYVLTVLSRRWQGDYRHESTPRTATGSAGS